MASENPIRAPKARFGALFVNALGIGQVSTAPKSLWQKCQDSHRLWHRFRGQLAVTYRG